MKKERLLKKELRELKRIRTAIMVGEHNGDYDAVEGRIEQIRAELGTAEDREVIFATEPKSVKHLDTCYTLGDFHKALEEYGSRYAVSRAWGVPNKELEDWVKKEEEKEMAKLTFGQYKPLVEQGMKPKEIAKTLGVKAQDVYNAKNEFKKAGLIEDAKKRLHQQPHRKNKLLKMYPLLRLLNRYRTLKSCSRKKKQSMTN